jgi:RecA/RadA recombinase
MCITLLPNIPTSCETIDKVLDGGIPNESITLVYGEAETGKTTLATQCAINCSKQGGKTLFIDCDGTFSGRRLFQMTSEKSKEISESIILMKPQNFKEQTLVIDKLTDYITKNLRLVIIDTITTLYRVKISESPEKSFELNRELNRQMALIAQTAKMHKIAVLLTSQVRSVFNQAHVSIEPVATRVLKFWADTIINMKPTENLQVIKAILEKSPKKFQSPPTCHLRIDETGIHEYVIH